MPRALRDKHSKAAALVMLGNFGRADGGRATWAYYFIPRLLKQYPELQLSIYGLRVEDEPDNSATVLSSVPEKDRDRLSIDFVQAKADRRPNAFAYWFGLPRITSKRPAPDFFLAIGSWVELLACLRARQFRHAGKIVWLRTIFADEKAHRYPRSLRRLVLGIEREVLKRADLLIANGDDTAAFYRGRGLDVTVIRNAIDFKRWRHDPPSFAGPVLNVAFIGRLASVKGIREFVALARQWDAPGNVRFHVVGFGPEEPLVREAEKAGKLTFHGSVPNDRMPALLPEFDVCVALTFKSPDGGTGGVSNAALEQMAAGRAIIAWRNEIFEQLVDDSSAYLAEQGSVAGLARAISDILANPEEAHRRAARAQETARAHSFDAHMQQFDRALAGLGLL